MTMVKSQCRGGGANKNYTNLVFVPQMGQGIIQNTVGESPKVGEFHF